jgi:hypothetical protein
VVGRRTVGRTASVAGALVVPLDDASRAPGRCTAEVPVGLGHLPPGLVRGHGSGRYAEEGGDVLRHPPVGLGIGLRSGHATHATEPGRPCLPVNFDAVKVQIEPVQIQAKTVDCR